MIEVAILFTLLGIACRKDVRAWFKWRMERNELRISDPNFGVKYDNWQMRKPGR